MADLKLALINLVYLVAASLFIMGLKRLGSPATARGGNQLSAVGMLIAIVATLFYQQILNPVEMLVGLLIGGMIGLYLAKTVKMTGMPEMVALLNASGGVASSLVAVAEVERYASIGQAIPPLDIFIVILTILIGTVTFSGSIIAWGKLSTKMSGNPILFPGIRVLTLLMFLGVVGCWVFMYQGMTTFTIDQTPVLYAAILANVFAFALGILLVIPIGGADMPVVIALFNSYSGLAGAASGFLIKNDALIVAGALVGASGIILTKVMCDAMNRSWLNVLLGGFGGDSAATGSRDFSQATVRQTTADDAAILMSYAQKVIVVPGYGLAVSQAQHQVRELADLLQEKGVEVKFAIHPVAGRMPGHMNVLLAEANVSYDLLVDMDDINPEFEQTDVVLIVGANDVVNPAAKNDPSSPIYGMPILEVDKAKNTIVMKRSMKAGYAGIENELFFSPKNAMLFGDAKATLSALISEVKTV
ncbi:MAG: NAD(P)(+) transhydrogenase (Re/Si-specific) subunit beta [Bacteroidetes Order II. Incertae sedis bacterium]|nr:NAD(P)(+) transhydrogenase (Re/Si-specific) subunit beta [Bacteroidetes Order II. bacterium]